MQTDPESPAEKARGFAAYCRSSAFEAADGPMMASAFAFLADIIEAMQVNDEQLFEAIEYAGFTRSMWIVDALRQKADDCEAANATISRLRAALDVAEGALAFKEFGK